MKTKKFFRKIVLTSILLTLLMVSFGNAYSQCGGSHDNNANSSSTKSIDNNTSNEVLYACPMHADVTSKESGYCSKCGMALVKNVEASENHDMKMMCDMKHDSKEKDNHNKNKMMVPVMGIVMGLMMAVMMIFVANN